MKKRFLAALAAFIILAGPGYAIAQTATQSIGLTLNWTDNSNNEDGFNVERGPAATGPFTPQGSTATNVTTFTQTIADPGNTQYCYRVNAFNKAGVSPYSNVACFTTPAIIVAPGTPSTLTCTATLTQGTQTLTLVCK